MSGLSRAASWRRGLGVVIAGLAFVIVSFLSGASGQSVSLLPALSGRVVDAANLLKPEERAAIEQKLKAHEDKTTDQLVVATVPSLQGLTRRGIRQPPLPPVAARAEG